MLSALVNFGCNYIGVEFAVELEALWRGLRSASAWPPPLFFESWSQIAPENTVEHHSFQEEACFVFKNREGGEEVILNSFNAGCNFRVDGGKGESQAAEQRDSVSELRIRLDSNRSDCEKPNRDDLMSFILFVPHLSEVCLTS